MARVIPKNQNDQLVFFETRVEEWIAAREELGLTQEQAEAVAAAAASARAAYRLAGEARLAAQMATQTLDNELARLSTVGGHAVATIKAKARRSVSPSEVYLAASIDAPSKPSYTALPPRRVGDVRLTPRANGNGVELRWASDLSSGGATFYTVQRVVTMSIGERLRIATEADTIGVVRDGAFIDTTLPVGFVTVQYTVTPCRQRGGGRNRGMVKGHAGQATYTPGTVLTRPIASAAA